MRIASFVHELVSIPKFAPEGLGQAFYNTNTHTLKRGWKVIQGRTVLKGMSG